MLKASTELIGHQEILKYLEQCALAQTLAHAYVLIGPEACGRKKLLEIFLCSSLKINSLENPDIRLLSPEKDTVTISQIRELRQWLQFSPLAGKNKVAIIDQAEKMNTESQNAFLKVLEEPIDNTYIFLLATHRRALLPTIYSRTVPIYFNPVPINEIKKIPDIDEIKINASHGRPGLLFKNSELKSPCLAEFLACGDPSARLRLWLQAQLPKEEIRDWLKGFNIELRNHLVQNYQILSTNGQAERFVKISRSLLESLAGNSGQNWSLIAENAIISL